ncbi:MAG: hypothetical protein AAFP19_17225 [Bacteroidota bacterium]
MTNSTRFKNKDWSSWLFLGIVLTYIRLYAPFGINETDGGFISAYAYRLLQGEQIYQDIIYVRPPMSIWLRALEMWLLPDSFELLSERILFYLKVALYAWMGAAVFYQDYRRWLLASIGFIICVHNYPAASWHTVDGILFGTAAFFLLFRTASPIVLPSLMVVMAMLCKQSFYPLLPLFLLMVGLYKGKRDLALATLSLSLMALAFYGYLNTTDLWSDYRFWTSGATGMGAAIQSGIWDYTKINPLLFALLPLLLPWLLDRKVLFAPKYYWYLFIAALMASYVWSIYEQQSFQVPVSQSRLLFLIGLFYWLRQAYRMGIWLFSWADWKREGQSLLHLASLLGLSWMAALSWGYSFPILFAIPYVYVLFEITEEVEWGTTRDWNWLWRFSLLFALLLIFRYAYEFVYRDGPRSAMKWPMEQVFPALKGIYSDEATYLLYSDLKGLQEHYGPRFKTLPAFPLSNYLTQTQSPLPLDWVIRPETNGPQPKLYQLVDKSDYYFFIEKSYGEQLLKNPKFELTKYVMDHLDRIEETPYFYVYQNK